MIRSTDQVTRNVLCLSVCASAAIFLLIPTGPAAAGALAVDDFKFDGPLGSQGASIAKLGENHFTIRLGHAPKHPTWCNMLYFQIVRNAKGNKLRVDVEFKGGNAYRFNHNSATWSYDAENWQAIRWCDPEEPSKRGDTLMFPVFAKDTVHFGAQVPFSYEMMVKLIGRWRRHPHVKVHVLGRSLGGRDLYRLEITDPTSPPARSSRWVHWVGNQHPGEHNSQWRIVGMIDWLLSDKGKECRKRSICHFVPLTSPDGPSNGWYRVNAQGVDMNRSYFAGGADREKQAHEAYVVQKDLEGLMASEAPLTDVWSMHTWGGPVEPILLPGPEIGSAVGPWEDFKAILLRNAPATLIEPLKAAKKAADSNHWNSGPHIQFGVTNVLCEGAGRWTDKQMNLDAGAALMKSIAEYYKGTRVSANHQVPTLRCSSTPRNVLLWGGADGRIQRIRKEAASKGLFAKPEAPPPVADYSTTSFWEAHRRGEKSTDDRGDRLDTPKRRWETEEVK